MITLLTIFHVIVCIFLVLVVLLQQGKGADWAGAFGGGGSQTTFGARGAGTSTVSLAMKSCRSKITALVPSLHGRFKR